VDQSQTPYANDLEVVISAAKEAAAAIRDLYDRSAAESYIKGDGSPVTDADLASDKIIRRHLAEAFPTDAILTEEGVDDQERLTAERCWVVDPIDGTQQFIDRTGNFDVLIALVVDHRPVAGLLLQPTTGTLLSATQGGGAWVERDGIRRPLRFGPAPSAPRLVTSIWLGAPENLPFLDRLTARMGSPAASVSTLGITARTFIPPENEFDVLIGLNVHGKETMAWEWDFAAADIVVHEGGGIVTDIDGNLHRYNKPIPRNVNGIVFAVDRPSHAATLNAIAAERAAVP
jgi:3'-phosphoadenosine 5'-phosphosulfate (PAPS) 3'-phosphatase